MPLLFDMPIEKLSTYSGTNPKPADFETYWDTAINEMQHLDPDIELIPADFQTDFAECFNMFFTGTNGARIHAKLLRPRKFETPHPAVLMFHGYSGNCGDWQSKLAYVAAGYTVAALDCRGQGGLSEDVGGVPGWTLRGHIIRGLDGKPEDLLYRHIFLDTALLARIVMDMPDVDDNRVGAMGGSQGGGLTLACASLEPRIIRAAPQYPFLSDYQRVWNIDQDVRAYDELRVYFRSFDPFHEREDAVWERLGYIDIQHLTSRIQGEVLMGTGLMDTVCPPSTQFAAYNKISSKKTVKFYPDFGHEALPGFMDLTYQFMMGL
ncbi:alpha/beta fold hydrolase [bacterium]|nr:alpha/beta fold hydrolase [bacterium]